MHYDPIAHRVYVAHGTEVTVVDVRKDRMVGRVRGIVGAHGIVTIPALGRGYADDGETGEVTVFQLPTLKPIGPEPRTRGGRAGTQVPTLDTYRPVCIMAGMSMQSPRQADLTRDKLLAAAFGEIHRNGFQAASLANILADTGLTKGALYHHFPDKKALGLAVIEEVVRPRLAEVMYEPLGRARHPLAAMIELLRHKARTTKGEDIALGCPLNNLTQEMSPIDEDFRHSLNRLLQDWIKVVAEALRRGQQGGEVRTDIDARETAFFIVASLEGCLGMSKNTQSPAAFRGCLGQLEIYLESLKA